MSNPVLLNYSGRPPLPIGKVEPFELHSGEILCLRFKESIDRSREVALAQSLGRGVGLATPAHAPRWGLGRPTVQRYLKRHLAIDEQIRVLRKLDLAGPEDLRFSPLTLRALLGIEVAFRQYQVVVFSIAGLDPAGIRRVLEQVKGLLQNTSAILLSYPSSLGHECPDGALCISVPTQSPTACPAG